MKPPADRKAPICPHCGSLKHYATKKAGRYRCAEKECRKDFTVQTGSVGGGIVEADETYFGQVAERRASPQRKGRPFTKDGKSGAGGKRAVVGLVERSNEGSRVRAFHVAVADGPTSSAIVGENIAREAHLMTDKSNLYKAVGQEFATHHTVKHSAGEYVRGIAHTNTVENYFLTFKRGVHGTYHHCAEKNLHRYLAEFEFRYNTRKITDGERVVLAVKGGEGKRLTYRQPH